MKLKNIRKKLNLTQGEMGSVLGLSHSTIQRLEKNENVQCLVAPMQVILLKQLEKGSMSGTDIRVMGASNGWTYVIYHLLKAHYKESGRD